MRAKALRWIVTGPGLDKEPSYAEPGTALSRTLGEALKSTVEATFYARDSITNDIHGYSERDSDGIVTTHQRRTK